MPDRLRAALGLAAGLLTLLLSGCGSTGTPTNTHAGESASSSGAHATKAHFIAQAEAICRTLSEQERPLRERQESLSVDNASSDKAFVALARQVVSFSRAADVRLRALARPAEDRALEQLLTGFAQEIVDANDIAAAAASQSSTIGEDAQGSLRRSIAANSALADTYGMKDCIESE
jgi:hypothetical protein